MSQDLFALSVDLRSAAAGLVVRSTQRWRELWEGVRRRYRAALAAELTDLAAAVELDPRTLQASMDALLSGLEPGTLDPPTNKQPAVALVVLAASVPSLAAQSVFPLLASGSAVILKPSRREPRTAVLLQQTIHELDPDVAAAVVVTPELRLDEANLEAAGGLDWVVAYGGDSTLEQISDWVQAPTRGSSLGHGWAAVYLDDLSPDPLNAVAHDVALFDQRGCLCPQVVVTPYPAAPVVGRLGLALEQIAADLPARPDTVTLGALRQMRDSAVAGGRAVSDQPLVTGLVVEAGAGEPVDGTPGGRSVRVHGDCTLRDAVTLLQPVASRLQSLSIAVQPHRLRRCTSAFASLAVDRIVLPGELHSPGFDWVTRQLRLAR